MRARGAAGPDVLTGGLVFASVAIGAGALLGVLNGALSLWVTLVSLAAGGTIGALAAVQTPTNARAGGFRDLSTAELLALAAFAAVSVRQFGWLVYEEHGTLLTLLRYNYGDLPLHWTYIQFLAGGAPFWPENPIAVGERLRYPLGVDLFTAFAVILGAGMRFALPAVGLLGAGAAAWALRRWGGALAVAGFLFSGGLAGFQLLWSWWVGDYLADMAWKNLYLALFVPQRGLLLALPVGLVLLWSWRRRLLRDEAGLAPWVEGILWGALPLVHLHTFLFVSIIFATWALGARRLPAAWPTLAWALAPATWGVWQVSDGFRAASLVGWQPGWVMEDANPLVFLLVNFGMFLPLALAALALAWRRRRREELLVLGPALVVFATLFFVRLAPWAWDNTKVMLWCYLLALPVIGSEVLARLGRGWRVAALVGLLFSGAASVVVTAVGVPAHLDVLYVREYQGVCEALASRPLTERVAVAPTFNHPVALCGHPLVLGYGGHLWSHGIDASRTQHRLEVLLRGEEGWREEAREIGATLLFWGSREQAAYHGSPRPWERETELLASGAWGSIYVLE